MGTSPLTRTAPMNGPLEGESTCTKRSYKTSFSARPCVSAFVANSWPKIWSNHRVQDNVTPATTNEYKSWKSRSSQTTRFTSSTAWSGSCATDSQLDAWSPISCGDVHVTISNWYVCNKGSKTWPVFVLIVSGLKYGECCIERGGPDVDKYLREQSTLTVTSKLDPISLAKKARALQSTLQAGLDKQDFGRMPALRFLALPSLAESGPHASSKGEWKDNDHGATRYGIHVMQRGLSASSTSSPRTTATDGTREHADEKLSEFTIDALPEIIGVF